MSLNCQSLPDASFYLNGPFCAGRCLNGKETRSRSGKGQVNPTKFARRATSPCQTEIFAFLDCLKVNLHYETTPAHEGDALLYK